ncbi:DUF6069 family protein [Micromonospora sp. NPDC049679]|uniref:DUF6069 family protein n=1 Tax=Micromonospora sp. NPDC049679 TaxID=3155920 RepID=UPI0034035589
MTNLQHGPVTATRPRARAGRRALVVLAAVLAASLVWLIAVPLLAIEVTVPVRYGASERVDLALVPVVFAALLAGLAGWALLAVLERFTTKARLIWTVIALVVFVVTLPWMPDATAAEITVLALLHAAVAAALIPGLPRAGRLTD